MLSLLYRLSDSLRHRARMRRAPIDMARGRHGEDLAHRFLRRQGYTIVARNFRTRNGAGEIDLVASESDYLVFVEVKARATDQFGTPDRAVDWEKQGHLERAAREYARRAEVEWETRPIRHRQHLVDRAARSRTAARCLPSASDAIITGRRNSNLRICLD